MNDPEEVPWVEDAPAETSLEEKDDDGDDGDDDEDFGSNLFSTDHRDPNDVFQLIVKRGSDDDNPLTVTLHGIQARYPHLLQSTGMTLWKGSEELCHYLAAHASALVEQKHVVELGAGLGLCGIVAHKLGAKQVILTDGDTDALGAMRRNVASNVGGDTSDIHCQCKQLLWGRNVDAFREKWAPDDGFDVVMGGDIAYAQESLEILFETALGLLSNNPGSVFVLSFVFRGGVTSESLLNCARTNHLECKVPDDGNTEGIYVFQRRRRRRHV